MKAIELFNSWQGEGKNFGVFMTFLRFKICKLPFDNPLCPFCDTRLKMKMSAEFEVTEEQLNLLLYQSNNKICLTGGEPSIYIDTIVNDLLKYRKFNLLEVETNGYNLPILVDKMKHYGEDNPSCEISINVSPKIFKQSDVYDYTELFQKVSYYDNIVLKLLVSKELYKFTDQLITNIKANNLNWPIYIMPIGVSINELISNSNYALDLATKHNVNITSRLQFIYNFI